MSRLAAHAPTSPIRIRRRRPHRSASAMATSDTSTPARATASATPSAWSDRPKALVTASPFWESRAPEKLATRATAASAASRPACSGVKGTGGTTGSGLSGGRRLGAGRGRGQPGGGVGERAASPEPRLDAQEPGEERHDARRSRSRAAPACESALDVDDRWRPGARWCRACPGDRTGELLGVVDRPA